MRCQSGPDQRNPIVHVRYHAGVVPFGRADTNLLTPSYVSYPQHQSRMQEEAEAALAASNAAPPPPTAAAAVAAATEMAPPLPGAIAGGAEAEADVEAVATATPAAEEDPLLAADISAAASLAGLGDIGEGTVKFVLDFLTAKD